MPRKREAADAVVKKIGQVMRERATDLVAEELPADIKAVLDRLRQNTSGTRDR